MILFCQALISTVTYGKSHPQKESVFCSEINNHWCEVCLNTKRWDTNCILLTGESDRALCFLRHGLCFIHFCVHTALSYHNVGGAGGTFRHINETQWLDCIRWMQPETPLVNFMKIKQRA